MLWWVGLDTDPKYQIWAIRKETININSALVASVKQGVDPNADWRLEQCLSHWQFSPDAFVQSNLQKFIHSYTDGGGCHGTCPTSTSGAVWGSASYPRTLWHTDQGNWTSNPPITRRQLYLWAKAATCKCNERRLVDGPMWQAVNTSATQGLDWIKTELTPWIDMADVFDDLSGQNAALFVFFVPKPDPSVSTALQAQPKSKTEHIRDAELQPKEE